MTNIIKKQRLVKRKSEIYLQARVPKSQRLYQAQILENLEKLTSSYIDNNQQFRITFWLFVTLPAPYKATRRVAGAGNVGEAGVGASVATDLASRTLAAERRRTQTVLLCDGKTSPKHLPWMAGVSIIHIHFLLYIYFPNPFYIIISF
jgi:ApbE superfamily uncharacterized protein (UPF0280 family)